MIHVETIPVGEDIEELREVLDDSDDFVGIYFSSDRKDSVNTSLTYASKTLINNYFEVHKKCINMGFVTEVEAEANWYEAYEPLILPFVRLFVPTDTFILYSLELARYIEVLHVSDSTSKEENAN